MPVGDTAIERVKESSEDEISKRFASICLFSVLALAMPGVQAWAAFPLWLSGALVVSIVLFIYRAYRTVTTYGWI